MATNPFPKTPVFEKALEMLHIAPGADYRVLDFGCGKGEFLGALSGTVGPQSRLVGYDAMEKFIALAASRYPNAEFMRQIYRRAAFSGCCILCRRDNRYH